MARFVGGSYERVFAGLFTIDPADEGMMNLANLFKSSKDAQVFAAGATIFEQGERGEFMYIVLEGEVEIRHDGKVVDTASVGGIIGEMALIDSEKRSASAVAQSDCKVAPVDARRFEFLVSETPNFALQVMSVLADRLRRTTDRAAG